MTRTDNLRKEAKEVLEWDILKFWAGMQDPRGGFYGEVSEGCVADKSATRNEELNARILWAYSNAFRIFKKKEYLMPAVNAKDYFLEHFMDHKFGGVYTSVDSYGEKLDTDAKLSNHALAVYALSEFYGATKDDETLKQVVNMFKIIEKQFKDEENGGYYETLNRDFSIKDDSKVAASHLYLLEAYANLYRVWKDEALRNSLSELVEILIGKFFNGKNLEQKFNKDWTLVPSGCRFGVDLEASWSVLDAAYALKDIDLISKVKPATINLFEGGIAGLQADGYVAFGSDENGNLDAGMDPWVQAEAVIACLCAWKYQNKIEAADIAFKVWDFIKAHLNGTADTIAFRMYPMHDARACMQIINIFR